RSSWGANCVGLTKIDTITEPDLLLARRTNEKCPSCSAPIVGTRATVRPRARKFAMAWRSAATVWTTRGRRFARLGFFMTTLQREHTRARFVDAALRLRLTYFD